ncbi:MAG: hypothetical protein LBU89_01030 [Fibromonadaceae bacterium]|jgi:hypothetical protein|nr:hypothetical protein [Fibromonadaceae bacterium]
MAIKYKIEVENNASSVVKEIDEDIETLNQSFTKVDAQANIFCDSLIKISELSKNMTEAFDDSMKKKAEAMKSLAKLEEEIRAKSLESQIECGEKELEITEEQRSNLLRIFEWYTKTAGELINEMLLSKEVQDVAKHAKAIEDSLGTTKKMLDSSKKKGDVYRLAYKTAAVGEASINAALAVLKTMTSVPYPLNIPLAAAQAVAAYVHVDAIKRQNMYTGGMIPGHNTLIMANEQGREAILNPMAVRAVGGEAGVNALNYGTANTYNNSQSNSNTIVINTAVMTQKTFRDEIEPVLKEAQWRR